MIDSFEKELIDFAKSLKQKAAESTTPLEEATNAFKALATFYAILRKHGTDEGRETGETTFETLQDDVHRVVQEESGSGAETPVRSRPRRNGGVRPSDTEG